MSVQMILVLSVVFISIIIAVLIYILLIKIMEFQDVLIVTLTWIL